MLGIIQTLLHLVALLVLDVVLHDGTTRRARRRRRNISRRDLVAPVPAVARAVQGGRLLLVLRRRRSGARRGLVGAVAVVAMPVPVPVGMLVGISGGRRSSMAGVVVVVLVVRLDAVHLVVVVELLQVRHLGSPI